MYAVLVLIALTARTIDNKESMRTTILFFNKMILKNPQNHSCNYKCYMTVKPTREETTIHSTNNCSKEKRDR